MKVGRVKVQRLFRSESMIPGVIYGNQVVFESFFDVTG
jgi:hypothetical protein